MNHFLIATVADPTVIASVRNFTQAYDYQAAANARLIAAAPELLDALIAALDVLPDCDNGEADAVIVQVRAAIAKAEGR
jgi:hypothetical protein